MPKEHPLTRDNFRLLLNWLDPDEQSACEEYERIRQRLIRIFVCRGCIEAETLADLTIDRVANKASLVTNGYVGDPALYFYGVANNIHLEWLRRKERQISTLSSDPATAIEPENEREIECLERCLDELKSSERNLILKYYEGEKRDKIENRKRLARSLGISASALQIRASRIRSNLQKCLTRCNSNAQE